MSSYNPTYHHIKYFANITHTSYITNRLYQFTFMHAFIDYIIICELVIEIASSTGRHLVQIVTSSIYKISFESTSLIVTCIHIKHDKLRRPVLASVIPNRNCPFISDIRIIEMINELKYYPFNTST